MIFIPEALCDIGLIARVRDADQWILGTKARADMGKTKPRDIATVTGQEWIEAQLADAQSLKPADIAERLGIDRREATATLRVLRSWAKRGSIRKDPNAAPTRAGLVLRPEGR